MPANNGQFNPDAFLADEQGGFDPDAFLSDETDYGKAGWGDVALESVSNIPSSLYGMGANIATAVTSPVDTASTMGKMMAGVAEKGLTKYSGMGGGEIEISENERLADQVGDLMADRYGSKEGFKRTLAEDPAGVLADLSGVLSGGGTLAARVPGFTGKIGAAVAKAGKAIDPVSMVAKDVATAGKFAGKVGSDIIGGLGTHTGGASLRTAFEAGKKGGNFADSFKRALRGDMPMDEVVGDAKAALSNIRKAKGEAYRSGMAQVSSDKSILDFGTIDKAVADVRKIGTFKGKAINKSTAEAMQKIDDVVTEWRKLDPTEFHTPEGMDALKQSIGDIRDSTDFGTPSRRMVDKVYHSVKNKISEQAPEYARTMADYEKGSELIRELEKTLSLGSKASPDTALRKLQSILRDNANTSYGRRVDLAQQLVDAGAPQLMEKLAGQANAPIVPRGLGKLGSFGAGVTALNTMNPAMAIPLAMTSPRLMGEAALYSGKAAGVTSGAARQLEQLLQKAGLSTRGVAAGAFQAGRLENQTDSSNK